MTVSTGGRNLVLFDGVCVLCSRSVRFLLRIDRHRRLLFAPLQGPTAREILARHHLGADLGTLVLVRDYGGVTESVAVRSTGVLLALAIVGGLWRVLSWLRVVPRPIRDRLYDLVATHRYRWFGSYDSCRLPRPGDGDRFLD